MLRNTTSWKKMRAVCFRTVSPVATWNALPVIVFSTKKLAVGLAESAQVFARQRSDL